MQRPLNQVPVSPVFTDDVTEGSLDELGKLASSMAPTPPDERPQEFNRVDQEVRMAIEKPDTSAADVALEKIPSIPKALTVARKSDQAECAVQWESNPTDAMARYRAGIKDMLATLTTISSATSRPSDELSAIARAAVIKHSRLNHD